MSQGHSLSEIREIRCRCGAWRLEDEICAWCDAGPRVGVEQLASGRWRYLVMTSSERFSRIANALDRIAEYLDMIAQDRPS